MHCHSVPLVAALAIALSLVEGTIQRACLGLGSSSADHTSSSILHGREIVLEGLVGHDSDARLLVTDRLRVGTDVLAWVLECVSAVD